VVWCLRVGTDEPKVGSVREWDNKNWPERSRFVQTLSVHHRAPLLRKNAVGVVSRKTRKTEPNRVLTFIARVPRLYCANLRMHGTNVKKA